MTFLARLLCLSVLCLHAVIGYAESTVVVASPFPKELLSAYKRAFDEQSPDFRVEFVNFPGANIISYLRDRAPGSRPDVFWASSPDAFNGLKRYDLLLPITELAKPEIPDSMGKLALNDPAGFYLGQALAGYGVMWNKRYLESRNLLPPRTWEELALPRYFGHIIMSSPSRSSTTHLIVESILQGKGWDDGWTLIMKIAANCATITERTFDVPNSITRGRFGLGPVVDFLALSGKYSGFPVDFAYASPSVVTPASIGLIKGTRNPEGAKAFIAFTLSKAGQRLLLLPEIGRLPILPSLYETEDRPADFPKLIDITRSSLPNYAPTVSESRYQLVAALFDQMITFRHARLVSVSKTLLAAERRLGADAPREAATLLGEARTLIYRVPVSERDVAQVPKTRGTRQSRAIAVQEAEWARQRDQDLRTAIGKIERATRLLKPTP